MPDLIQFPSSRDASGDLGDECEFPSDRSANDAPTLRFIADQQARLIQLVSRRNRLDWATLFVIAMLVVANFVLVVMIAEHAQ